ncbi:MAG: tyrosine-protein phosphatase [Treponemataceae bacterium]|nr:tyrosine-protein phosphatase [Treponemataceae bacterium]
MADIELTHAKNFRDLGGIKTIDGRQIRTNMLIRGRSLFHLKEKDYEILKKSYNLKTVIDLRTKKEADEKPNKVFEDIHYYHMPILTEALVGISHEKKVSSFKSLTTMPLMESLYISMVKDESLDNIVRILKFILTSPMENYSILFHCSAGKDRTGIIAALLLSFLGVDKKQIIDDYMFTNKYTKRKALLAYIGLLIVKRNKEFASKIRNYLLAKENFIEGALHSLEEDFGSIEKFFEEKLNFTSEEKEAIKNKFLE